MKCGAKHTWITKRTWITKHIWIIGLVLCLCVLMLGLAEPAAAQAFRHPFAIGAQEGGVGRASGLSAWIIGEESAFYQLLAHALDSAKHGGMALFGLLGLGFAYGVFHAAGPGHGKAVITSYMISNEKALRRGLVISCLAALLQGLVAIILIGTAALIFNATAQRMTAAAHALELAAYCGIVLLGLALVWRKGSALIMTLRGMLTDAAARWTPGTPELAMQPAVLRAFSTAPSSIADMQPSVRNFAPQTRKATRAKRATKATAVRNARIFWRSIPPVSATAFPGNRRR